MNGLMFDTQITRNDIQYHHGQGVFYSIFPKTILISTVIPQATRFLFNTPQNEICILLPQINEIYDQYPNKRDIFLNFSKDENYIQYPN